MKRLLVLLVALFAFTGAAMADTTSATSSTTLNVNVIAPLTLSCTSSITFNVVKSGTADQTPAGKQITCSTGGGTVSGVTAYSLLWQVGDLSDGATPTPDTIAATNVAVSTTALGTYTAAAAASTQAAVYDNVSATSVASSYSFYVKVTVPQSQAAGAYTATIGVELDVTYTP